MKKFVILPMLILSAIAATPAFSAQLTCHLYVKPGGWSMGNGTSSCDGIDFSFGNSTSGKWTIVDITDSVSRIHWIKGCSSGISCDTTVRAYTRNTASAYIHYDNGTIEYVSAEMWYETGH